MPSNQHKGAVAAVVAGLMLASAVVSFYVFRMFFAAMVDPYEPSSGAMPLKVLLILSLATATLVGILSRRNVARMIRRHGLPGFVPAPDPLVGQGVQLTLTTPVKTAKQPVFKPVFTAWVPADKLAEFFKTKTGAEVTFVNEDHSYRLTLTRPRLEDPNGEEILLVKFATNRKRSLLSLEKLPGSRGKFVFTNEDRSRAQCSYTLTHLGMADRYAKSQLTIAGHTRVMKAIILGA